MRDGAMWAAPLWCRGLRRRAPFQEVCDQAAEAPAFLIGALLEPLVQVPVQCCGDSLRFTLK